MARYTGSVCRQCRREGTKLFLKGDRCYSDKCAVTKRHTPPGMHGQGRRKQSEYGIQLREKQKVRRAYGVLESQFRKYYDVAANMRGVTGDNMLELLERRLGCCQPDGVFCKLIRTGQKPPTFCFKDDMEVLMIGHFNICNASIGIIFLVHDCDCICVRRQTTDMLHHSF